MAIVQLLREALNLPPDSLHAQRFPDPPRWSRVKLTRWPNGVWITIRPRLVRWILTIVLAPLIAAIIWWFIVYQSTGDLELRFRPTAKMELRVLIGLTTLFTVALLVGINAILRRSGRTSVVAVVDGKVDLVETGYVSPINHCWPLDRLVDIDALDDRRLVLLHFIAEPAVPIRQKLNRRERAWVIATIQSARQMEADDIAIAKSVSPPALTDGEGVVATLNGLNLEFCG